MFEFYDFEFRRTTKKSRMASNNFFPFLKTSNALINPYPDLISYKLYLDVVSLDLLDDGVVVDLVSIPDSLQAKVSSILANYYII